MQATPRDTSWPRTTAASIAELALELAELAPQLGQPLGGRESLLDVGTVPVALVGAHTGAAGAVNAAEGFRLKCSNQVGHIVQRDRSFFVHCSDSLSWLLLSANPRRDRRFTGHLAADEFDGGDPCIGAQPARQRLQSGQLGRAQVGVVLGELGDCQ